jgi:DNA-binding GntR family transcriptional regulator
MFLIEKNPNRLGGQIVFYALKDRIFRGTQFAMKTDTVFKRAYNDALDLISEYHGGRPLPSENRLSAQLNVSRTTVRKILTAFTKQGIVTGSPRNRIVAAPDSAVERYPEAETVTTAAQVEKRFMEWMLRGNARPGTIINELELARQFGVATSGIREFLNRFQRFGLIEKRPNAGWMFKGFTPNFALELFEIRELFELRSAKAIAALADDAPIWPQLKEIRDEHLLLLHEIERRFQDFSDLDNRFHRLINSAAPNRFVDGFNEIITMIFHYHYQWNKRDERQRNEVAIREHLDYIDALISRDIKMIETACQTHLASAKRTLRRSTSAQNSTA